MPSIKKLLNFLKLFLFIIGFLLIFANFVFAQDQTDSPEQTSSNVLSEELLKEPEVQYPTVPGYGTITAKTTPPEYIRYVFVFSIWVLGIIVLANLIYAGFQWFLSGVNSELAKEAQKRIENTLYGVFLLLGTYLILNTINPDLLNLKLTPITEALPDIPKACYFAGGQVDSCDAYNRLPINDKRKFCEFDYCQVIKGQGFGKGKEPKNSLCFWDQSNKWDEGLFLEDKCKTVTCDKIKTCADYNQENLPNLTTSGGGWGIYRACYLNVCSVPGLCIMDENNQCVEAKGKIDPESGKFIKTGECIDNDDSTCPKSPSPTICNMGVPSRWLTFMGKNAYKCTLPQDENGPCDEDKDCKENFACQILETDFGRYGFCKPKQ